jgi:2-oxoglutarate dehydrogenase complex dihydrolipoamide succinyltransferase (E2) component
MTSVKMPQLGETVVEGTILKWLKKEGERVELDEPLLEISTDKVDTEVPSSVAGVLAKILVREGQTVKVGTDLAEIEAGDGARAARGSEPPSAAAPAASATTLPDRGKRSRMLSPLVRKLAAENAVDLSLVIGTGTGGRITKTDVLSYVASRGDAAPGAVPVPAAVAGGEEVIPVSHIRKAIAEHMTRSLQVSARAWNAVEVDMENVARLRERTKDAFRAREGFNLTHMPFVSRAVIEALLAFPMVNAELRGEEIVLRRYVNLSIAVSYEDGLIVPVVKNADTMSLIGLARAVNDVAVRARAKQLKPDEVHGGTFTITNPGPFGSLISVPIINQPQSAILAFDSVEKRPVVIDDAIAIRHMVYLSMSWDHRVIDGAIASQFLSLVKQNLETWDFAEDLGL